MVIATRYPTVHQMPGRDALAKARLRKRAADEIARGLFVAARAPGSDAPRTPTVAEIELDATRQAERCLQIFDRRASEVLIELRAHDRQVADLRARIAAAADAELTREEAIVAARRLQARINRIQLADAGRLDEIDREVARLRVAASAVFTRADGLLAAYYGYVLRSPHTAHLPLQPPITPRPAWLSATDLDDVLETLFPTPEEIRP